MSRAALIDGKAAAAHLRGQLAALIPNLTSKLGRPPGLAVVLVGDDPASAVYVRSKETQTLELGMKSFAHKLPADTSQADLRALVEKLNADPAVDGILVQLPLPKHLDEMAIIDAIHPDKDVDGLHVVSGGRLAAGLPGHVSCTPLGCMILIRNTLGPDIAGKEAVVIGRSILVGKPVAQLLLAANCTVTMAHSRTANLADVVRRADIVVAAVGRPLMVKGDWLKPGCTVIDVGINRVDGKLLGDVDFASASTVAAHITPVPGGVGPMTIACLLRNTVVAACLRGGIAMPDILR
jgi:methylenetetrahydrofolate dehydrogenase (NADP+) / methenyltetrahydrofolate cyclohydrolase